MAMTIDAITPEPAPFYPHDETTRWVVGLDLGQSSDPTAIAVLAHTKGILDYDGNAYSRHIRGDKRTDAPDGLLGAGLYSAQWLYNLRPLGFPIFVIAYALLKDADPTKGLWQGSVAAGILSSVAVTVALVCAATVLVTAGHGLLPHTMLDPVRFSPLRLYIAGCQIGLSIAGLIVLWVRLRSVLDLWLMVVMCAYAIEVCVIVFPVPVRFSMGWYAGRVYGLVSGSLLLFVLLYETTALYGQLLRALLAQRREREARLLTGDAVAATVAHEIKQPLSAMTMNANASLRWLDRAAPDIDEAKAALQRIVANGHRAGAVIENIRALFKRDARPRTSLDVNTLIREALALVRDDLQTHQIAVQADYNQLSPRIEGNQVQLQQVLVNLITNAIDSMATGDGERVLSLRSKVHDSGSLMVSVEDVGKGIEPSAIDRIFNPLFTTKTHGMGMGLDYRGPWRAAVGDRQPAPRCHFSLHAARPPGALV
jgi:signal transduction histidine kinase